MPAGVAAPSARVDGTIAYDAPGRRLILFGGLGDGALNDLWAYSVDARQWLQLSPQGTKPDPRFGHTLTFDPARRRMIVFGGQAGGFFSDVWAYEIAANRWTRLADNSAGPSKRYGHSGVYDAARDRIVISHGFTDAGRFDDTWAFSLGANQWTNLSPSNGRPLRRCLHHAVPDDRNNQMLLYGGCASGAGPCPLGDLWAFNYATNRWTEITGGAKPGERQWFGLSFDEGRGRAMLFGGSGRGGNLNDTWAYDPGARSWSALATAGETPAARSRHESGYAADLAAVFFFGGRTNQGETNELWKLGAAPTGPRLSLAGASNAFSGDAAAVAPEEIVSLYGSLGGEGAAVTVNGAAATEFFVSAEQINVLIPAAVAGAAEAEIKVTHQGETSAALRVPVVAAHPGLYARAINQDGTLNGADNAAAPGSIVVLYATGASGEMSVTVDGRAAELLYAGPAPGFAGLQQINARLPQGVSGEVAVVLRSGGAESRAIAAFVR